MISPHQEQIGINILAELNQTLKIVMLASSYPRFPGDGTAPFVKSLAEALAKRGHHVEVVAPYDELVQKDVTRGITVHRFHYAPTKKWHIMGHARALESDTRLRPLAFFLLPIFLLAAFFSLLKVTRQVNANVIYCHWVIPNGLPAVIVAKLLRLPLLISLHGSDIYVARKNKLFGSIAGQIFKQAKTITACGPHLLEAAIALGAPRDRCKLLAWGADPEIFNPALANQANRRTFGWIADETILISIGRLVYKKGFEFLIQAMPKILECHPNTRLFIFGDGLIREQLLQLAEQVGVQDMVVLPGRLRWDQVPLALANSDAFILPSVIDQSGNVDGLPTVLLEAMASQLPVIATRVAGIPLVIRDGDNGILVPPNDAQAIAQAANRLLDNSDERSRFALSARRSVETEFNWLEVVKKLEDWIVEPGKQHG